MNQILQSYIPHITRDTENRTIRQVIQLLVQDFPGGVTFSSSFSFEDQLITHEILHHELLCSQSRYPDGFSGEGTFKRFYLPDIAAIFPVVDRFIKGIRTLFVHKFF